MQARLVPAANGVRWLIDGWRIFRAAPLAWLAIVFGYVLLTNALAVVPVAGVPAALFVVPPLSFGLMVAARAARKGERLDITMLFAGFREHLRPQLALGAAYMAGSLAIYGAVVLADQGGGLRLLLSGQGQPDELDVGALALPVLVAAAAYTPLMMALWFAPALVGWQSMGAAKAAFFSFAACMINWRPFLAYGAAASVVLILAPLVILAVLLVLSGGALHLNPAGLIFPLLLVLLPTLFASFYASYRDIFPEAPE